MRDWIKDAGPSIVSFTAVLISALSLLILSEYNRRTLIQKQHEEERKEIYKKLNSFYGPLQRLLGKSATLHELFMHNRPEGFRTLVALLDGEVFTGNDNQLLEQILKIGKQIDGLILNNSGLIDDDHLKRILDKASTHFTLIRLAKDKHIIKDIDRFKGHVFPRDAKNPSNDLNALLDAEVKRLKGRLNELNSEIYKGWFSQQFADIRSKLRHIEADERGPILERDDYSLPNMWADTKVARLNIESVEYRLRALSDQLKIKTRDGK